MSHDPPSTHATNNGALPPAEIIDAAFPLENPGSPQLALASDGRLLLSTADLGDRDLDGRESFTGVFLTPDEARRILASLDGAAADAASRLAGKLSKR